MTRRSVSLRDVTPDTMINFRFHLVSLVAVFLALAAGIVIGSTVVDRAIVEGLRDRIDDVESRADSTRSENETLVDSAGRQRDELAAHAPFAVEERLQSVPIVVIAVRGVDTDVVASHLARLAEAGADAPAVVWLEPEWALERAEDGAALAEIVGFDVPADQLRRLAFGELAERLGRGALNRSQLAPGSDDEGLDLIEDFEAQGFLTVELADGRDRDELTRWPLIRPDVLVVTGSEVDAGVPPVEADVARAFAARDVSVVVSDSVPDDDVERGQRVEPIRGSALGELVATVDNGESSTGQVAAVLALVEARDGLVNHYGYATGADRTFPEWTEP